MNLIFIFVQILQNVLIPWSKTAYRRITNMKLTFSVKWSKIHLRKNTHALNVTIEYLILANTAQKTKFTIKGFSVNVTKSKL